MTPENIQMRCLLEETKERAGCPPSIHRSPWMSLIFSSPLNRRSKGGQEVLRSQRWKYELMPNIESCHITAIRIIVVKPVSCPLFSVSMGSKSIPKDVWLGIKFCRLGHQHMQISYGRFILTTTSSLYPHNNIIFLHQVSPVAVGCYDPYTFYYGEITKASNINSSIARSRQVFFKIFLTYMEVL